MPEPDHVVSARRAYDHSVEHYVHVIGTTVNPRFEARLDRAALDAFADQVAARGTGQVLDIGCGPGRIAAHLAERGLDVRGVDISPRMVEAARLAHPGLRFAVGSLTDVPVADDSVVAAVYWYSIIATPTSELPAVWAELDRILHDEGLALIAFQTGEDERVDRPDAYGSSTTLSLYRHAVDEVARSLAPAGFEVNAQIVRQPELEHETTPQAFLFVRRAVGETDLRAARGDARL